MDLEFVKLNIKHPNERRLEKELEKRGKKKINPDAPKKKEITIPCSHKKIKKEEK